MHLDVMGLCFTSAAGLPFRHDPSLVVLSYVIAVCGSYAAIELIDRWRSARRSRTAFWQFACAAALGGTIWSMHFIAMLAMRIDLPLTYAPGMTVLSLLIAIAVVWFGLQIISTGASRPRMCCAGVTIGLGVATMHYVGMSALRFPGHLAYTPSLWSLSIVIGIGAATAALWLALTVRAVWQRGLAALIMGAAICAMHYVGMAAAVFQVDASAAAAAGLSGGPIAAAVGLTTFALIVCALVFVGADRRVLAAARRDAEVLRLAHAQLAQKNHDLEEGRRHLDAVLNNIAQGICLFDSAQRLVVSNRRYGELYDMPPDATRPGRTVYQIIQSRQAGGCIDAELAAAYVTWLTDMLALGRPATNVVTLRNGRVVSIFYQPLADGGWVATHEDITERRQAEVDIVFMARHDSLTRLPNRTLFNEKLDQAVDLLGRGIGCAVLFLDLDHFKLVNDTLGHAAGDSLLLAAADRLQACVRDVDTVSRLGGDEFAILQTAVDRAEDAALLSARIIAAFEQPFDLDGQHVVVGVSIGIALAPLDGSSADKLLKNADIALYLGKAEGRGMARFFEPQMDAWLMGRRSLELDMQTALTSNAFEVFYQPKVHLVSGRITGCEALLRWHHPTRGSVSPSEFIPVAEDTGMIVPIGEWVLRTACQEAQGWPEDTKVAVNLSPVQFRRGHVVETVQAALAASGLAPHRLELEITESVLLQDGAATLAVLTELRQMGVAIALDDFGTGYSSLSYLRSFPFDRIKIDQSFVRDLAVSHDAMSIIRAITGLGHSLRMETTAEGVETAAQLDALRAQGCTEIQGYLFSHPKSAAEVLALMRDHQRQPERAA